MNWCKLAHNPPCTYLCVTLTLFVRGSASFILLVGGKFMLVLPMSCASRSDSRAWVWDGSIEQLQLHACGFDAHVSHLKPLLLKQSTPRFKPGKLTQFKVILSFERSWHFICRSLRPAIVCGCTTLVGLYQTQVFNTYAQVGGCTCIAMFLVCARVPYLDVAPV